jgi:hypothetical protein
MIGIVWQFSCIAVDQPSPALLSKLQGQHEESLNVASRALSTLAAVPDAGPVAAMFRMRRGAALFSEQRPLQQAPAPHARRCSAHM